MLLGHVQGMGDGVEMHRKLHPVAKREPPHGRQDPVGTHAMQSTRGAPTFNVIARQPMHHPQVLAIAIGAGVLFVRILHATSN